MQLDTAQSKFVRHGDGHALVLAGAGSGKTECCVSRAASRIISGVSPQQMLMLTFTNKAAAEMRERIVQKLEGKYAAPQVSTFHGFGFRFIRNYAELSGRRPNPSIMDDKDLSQVIASYVKERGFERDPLKAVFAGYDLARSHACDLEKSSLGWPLLEDVYGQFAKNGSADEIIAIARMILPLYEEMKVRFNLLDFNDLIMLPIRALERHDSLRNRIKSSMADLTIDESQDNNEAQYQLMKLLAGDTVVMVGDDDQAIYAFRGAEPANLSKFIKEFQPEKYYLENNYRSLPDIVDSAAHLIRCNQDRLEKNPVSTRPHDGQKQVFYSCYRDNSDLSSGLAAEIRGAIDNGVSPGSIYVLYRTNVMARVLEADLLQYRIPYDVVKGVSFLDRMELRMAVSLARIILNQSDVSAFSYVAKIVPGLGAKSVDGLIEQSDVDEGIWKGQVRNKKVKEGLKELREGLARLKSEGPVALIPWMEESDLIYDWLWKFSKGDTEDETETRVRTRYGYLREFALLIGERVRCLGSEASLEDQWSEVVGIVTDASSDNSSDKVSLMTIHAAKGLQSEHVHVVGVSQNLLPFERNGNMDLEEERRLAYVAFTRAQSRLFLHHAESLFLNGQSKDYEESQFITEAKI